MKKARKQAKRAPSSWRRGIGLAGGAPRSGVAPFGRWPGGRPAGVRSQPAPTPLRCAPPAKPIPCSILSRIEHGIGYRSRVAGCGGLRSPALLYVVHLSYPGMILPVPQKPRLAAPLADPPSAPSQTKSGRIRQPDASTEPRPLPAESILGGPGHRSAERPLSRQDRPAAPRPRRPRTCRRRGRRLGSAMPSMPAPRETRSRRLGATRV